MSEFDPQLPYLWSDLRERPIGELQPGAIVVRLVFPSAWQTDAAGRMSGVFGLPTGSAWTITARDGRTYTLERSDGQAHQTVELSPSFPVVAVEPGSR